MRCDHKNLCLVQRQCLGGGKNYNWPNYTGTHHHCLGDNRMEHWPPTDHPPAVPSSSLKPLKAKDFSPFPCEVSIVHVQFKLFG